MARCDPGQKIDHATVEALVTKIPKRKEEVVTCIISLSQGKGLLDPTRKTKAANVISC